MHALWHLLCTQVNDMHTWAWNAIHIIVHMATLPFIVSAAIDTAKVLVASLLVVGVLMAHPRTRRVTMAIVKYVNRHSPTWAKYVLLVCGMVPGQADEFIVVAILLFPILRNGFNRRVFARTIRYAWAVR